MSGEKVDPKDLEPAVLKYMKRFADHEVSTLEVSAIAAMSAAISLKRIADSLEVLRDENGLVYSLYGLGRALGEGWRS